MTSTKSLTLVFVFMIALCFVLMPHTANAQESGNPAVTTEKAPSKDELQKQYDIERTIFDFKTDRVVLQRSSPNEHDTMLKVVIPPNQKMTLVLIDDEGKAVRFLIEQMSAEK